MQSFNGQSLPQPNRSKPKRHNAKLCPVVIQQRIINSLANGDSVRAIARALRISPNTVVAVRDEAWTQVAARKQRIAAQAELNATLAAERMTDKLQSSDDIPLNTLVPTFGVNVDKMLALRGDVTQTIHHEHFHVLKIQHQYLVECLHAMNHRKPLPVLPAELVETDQVAEKAQSKKSAKLRD